jgi:hypothetical protein
MGGFSEKAIDRLEFEGDEDEMSMYATEVAHLRELCEERAKQLSCAETEVRLLADLTLRLHDRLKYYGDIVTLEDLELLMALVKTARRTLE